MKINKYYDIKKINSLYKQYFFFTPSKREYEIKVYLDKKRKMKKWIDWNILKKNSQS